MELMLWQWSTSVQVTSLLMIAAFFAVLSRSLRGPETGYWIAAWTLNFVSLASALSFWYFGLDDFGFLVRPVYMGTKTAFVLLLLQGALIMQGPRKSPFHPTVVASFFGLYVLAAAFIVETVDVVGVVQQATIGALFGLGALLLARRPSRGLSWLAVGFFVRSALGFVETAAYVVQLTDAPFLSPAMQASASTFRAVHSSFDAGVEWFIALGCVLALSERAQQELRRSNTDLLSTQEDLLRLVERDPLTGLANRRSLAEIFRSVKQRGATLLFFDLDDFKTINDREGHLRGDACLKTFAIALTECFRPGDAIVRHGGDEFLVIAHGLSRARAAERVNWLRKELGHRIAGTPFDFSVGLATLRPGEDPDEALHRADAAMYEDKASRRRELSRQEAAPVA